jgi:hypothetical protein
MFLGHYGLALAAKRVVPRTSLGTLAFAAQWLDELWPILLLLGLERVRIVPGLLPANALDFVHYPISHSLVMVVVWAVVIGTVYGMMRRDRRAGMVVGALVASHWVLDLLMHRPDLPLWPGSRVLVGLGAWRSVPLTLVLELAVFGGGLALYLRATRARDRVGTVALWAMVAFMVLAFLGATFGAPPPGERALAIGGLAIWLFVPWYWWIDQHRDVVAPR